MSFVLSKSKLHLIYIGRKLLRKWSYKDEIQITDLRRPDMHKNLILRHQSGKSSTGYLIPRFYRIETQSYQKHSEGAIDICAKSCASGKFYALPQSPSFLSSFSCFGMTDISRSPMLRDEDLRADSKTWFTQIVLKLHLLMWMMLWKLMKALLKKVSKNAWVELKEKLSKIHTRKQWKGLVRTSLT